MALGAGPAFIGSKFSETPGVTHAQVLQFLKSYYFWCGFYVFGAYVALRLITARIYASAMLAAVEPGGSSLAALGHAERAQLARLGLLCQRPEPERHPVVKAIGWTGSLTLRAVGKVLAVVLWFTFVSQIFIGEFLNYHAAQGWLNQPLAQLPLFFHAPDKDAEPK